MRKIILDQYHEDKFDLNEMEAMDVLATCIKLTQGAPDDHTDELGPTRTKLVRAHQASGGQVKLGFYHFMEASLDGKMQAERFIKRIEACGGLREGDLKPMLDYEDDVYEIKKYKPIDILIQVAHAEAFFTRMEEYLDAKGFDITMPALLWYTGRHRIAEHVYPTSWVKRIVLWLCDFAPPLNVYKPFTIAHIWQMAGELRSRGFTKNTGDYSEVQDGFDPSILFLKKKSGLATAA